MNREAQGVEQEEHTGGSKESRQGETNLKANLCGRSGRVRGVTGFEQHFQCFAAFVWKNTHVTRDYLI